MTSDEAAAVIVALTAAGLFEGAASQIRHPKSVEGPPESLWKLSGRLPDLSLEELRCRCEKF
jgi:hypothetical protein